MARRWAIVAVVGFVGCESLRNPPAPAEVVPAASTPHRITAVPPEVIPAVATQPATQPEPELPPDPLGLVAECLGRGDQATAAVHLEAHVRGNPDQLMFRAQLAELFVRLGRDEPAKVHFERFAADARHSTGLPRKHLVHVHTRLMEIAQRADDHGTEVLHRGVGLLLLVAEQDALLDRDEGFCEEMLCKALKSLAEAKELNPGDAQVRVWLAEAHDRAGNRRAAEAERAVARTAVVPTGAGPILTLRE